MPIETNLMTEELSLAGLHCADCAVTIEKTVAKVEGVEQVQANFSAGKVKIKYDSEKVGHDDLVRSVEKIGYRVNETAHRDIEKRKFWKEREFHFVLLSGLALGAGLVTTFFTGDPALWNGGFSVSVLFYLVGIFFGAFHFSREGWAAIRNLNFNMDFLMSVAIVGAIIIGEYVEAASLAFLFSLAELLESYAVERARNSLRALIDLTPDDARVQRNGEEVTISVGEVKVGETVIIRPGEKIPVDGKISSGASSVDQSPITGESVPVSKKENDTVFAGSINVEGYMEVEVTEKSDETVLARIIHMVEEAESKKAPSEKFVEKFARIYTPTVVGLAVAVAVFPSLLFGAAFNAWFIKALTLLVIACPCALVISTPVSVLSALTSASRNGVLIKGGVYLEELSHIDVIAFDKTGTLTMGRFKVTDILPLNGTVETDLLRIAASLETRSEHPIAKAILSRADGMELEEAHDFESVPGRGVRGRLNGETYYVGRPDLFEELSLPLPADELGKLQDAGKTTMLVGTRSQFLGIIGLADEIRPDALEAIARLQHAGKEVVMITGDNEQTARAIAGELGLTHYHAELLPDEKLKEIEYLQKKHGKVAMVGDGVNDAPALAAASVGIAMGAAGSDTALETADIALMADDLSKLPYLIELSQRARNVIKQNIWASILIKFSLAFGVFPGIVSLVIAVLVGDMGASLGVTSNAMRLARINPK